MVRVLFVVMVNFRIQQIIHVDNVGIHLKIVKTVLKIDVNNVIGVFY